MNVQVRSALRTAFVAVDDGYFNQLGDVLAKRMQLREQIAGLRLGDANYQQPDVIGQLEALELEQRGGATAVLALILADRLFVANIGGYPDLQWEGIWGSKFNNEYDFYTIV
jgi:hypothetical protein